MSRAALARTLAIVGIAAWAVWTFLDRSREQPFVPSPHELACDALSLYVADHGRAPTNLAELFGGPTPPELGPTRLKVEARKATLVFEDAAGATRAECGVVLLE